MEYASKIIRNTDYTVVSVLEDSADDPAGATHEYVVELANTNIGGQNPPKAVKIHFQKGPIKENGVNGVQNEDLMAIVIDRLQHFQKGNFSCRENAIALTKLEEALLWLDKRTNDRKARGVEGLTKK